MRSQLTRLLDKDQALACEFGATDIVTERGDDGVAAVKDLTAGLGAYSVIEAVGNQQSMDAGHRCDPPGWARRLRRGVNTTSNCPARNCSSPPSTRTADPPPVRRFLPDRIDLIWRREINPGRVFDLTLPLEQAADGYRAMDERRAIKVLLQP